MTDYVLFFEITSGTLMLANPNIFKINRIRPTIGEPYELGAVDELIDDEITRRLDNEIKELLPEFNLKNIYHILISFGYYFQFIAIYFEYRGSLDRFALKYMIKSLIQKINKCYKYTDFKIVSRILTNFYVNNRVTEILNTSFKFNRDNTIISQKKPFLLKLLNFEGNHTKSKIDTTIFNYIKCNFSNLLRTTNLDEKRLIISDEHIITNIRKINEPDIINSIYKWIRLELWCRIGDIYSYLSEYYLFFDQFLLKCYYNYYSLNGKTLLKLREYYNEIYEDLKCSKHDITPNLFLQEFDDVIFKTFIKKEPNIVLFNDSNPLHIEYSQKYRLFFNRALEILKAYLKLVEDLEESLSIINYLITQKQRKITSFSREELEQKLLNIREKEFREQILIPILRDLGYDDIQDMHGQHEYGIDILFRKTNNFGVIEWNAIVAKRGNINKKGGVELSQKLRDIFDQTYEAFSMEHLEKNYGDVKITRVFIATNGVINYYAKKALQNKDPLIEGSIFFIDKNTLLNLF